MYEQRRSSALFATGLAVILLLVRPATGARCAESNYCNGHGTCIVSSSTCACFVGWGADTDLSTIKNPDCSSRAYSFLDSFLLCVCVDHPPLSCVLLWRRCVPYRSCVVGYCVGREPSPRARRVQQPGHLQHGHRRVRLLQRLHRRCMPAHSVPQRVLRPREVHEQQTAGTEDGRAAACELHLRLHGQRSENLIYFRNNLHFQATSPSIQLFVKPNF